jgi:CBS domain-containing protein
MAGELIVERGIPAVPVIDPNGVLVGEISRRMILQFLVKNL